MEDILVRDILAEDTLVEEILMEASLDCSLHSSQVSFIALCCQEGRRLNVRQTQPSWRARPANPNNLKEQGRGPLTVCSHASCALFESIEETATYTS